MAFRWTTQQTVEAILLSLLQIRSVPWSFGNTGFWSGDFPQFPRPSFVPLEIGNPSPIGKYSSNPFGKEVEKDWELPIALFHQGQVWCENVLSQKEVEQLAPEMGSSDSQKGSQIPVWIPILFSGGLDGNFLLIFRARKKLQMEVRGVECRNLWPQTHQKMTLPPFQGNPRPSFLGV